VKTKSGNLYHDFIWKCYELLDDKGELVFIVPSDFLKLTSSGKILCEMLENGTFTHIFQPNKENLFNHASIDVIVFRYCKDKKLNNKVIINGTEKYLMNMNGIVTFSDTKKRKVPRALGEDFTIFVGMVSGKEAVFKNNLLGDKEVLNGKNLVENYIILEDFPCDNDKVNEYMLEHKSELMERKIRKFTEKNWYQWGALRNIESVKEHEGKECIYVKTLTRSKEVGFIDNVRLFGGGLLVMIPKKKMNLHKVLEKINSESFRNNYMYSGRFKIGHKQLSNAVV
jgi:adenine-specific DNA-methyltransferase